MIAHSAVHLVDSYYCSNSANFVSVLLLTLSTMLQLEMPHVNVLSKIDLLKQYSGLGMDYYSLGILSLHLSYFVLDFNLEYYTEVMDLKYLHQYLDQSTSPQLAKLNKAICDLIEDFSLVSFTPLNIQVRLFLVLCLFWYFLYTFLKLF